MPNYAEGLPIPEWPLVFIDQSADDNTAGTATGAVAMCVGICLARSPIG
jgi:hypothetical protein